MSTTLTLGPGPTEVEITEFDPIFSQLTDEINGVYDFDSIPFEPGDVVLDIGAHKGIVSIYLAKTYGVRCYAYEPVAQNYQAMCANIRLNGLAGLIFPHSFAISADGRDLEMVYGSHSAEASAFYSTLPYLNPPADVHGPLDHDRGDHRGSTRSTG